MDEQIIENAMKIIMSAGDARVCTQKALDALAEFDIEKAKELMKEANRNITDAHKVQTDAIQGETRGEKAEYSLLFAHAQDTLMTIYSEINIAKQLIKVMEAFDKRIEALENK
ncbi:MAG: PTS lactose/cellobiose transporter subunit IIA [Mobilitalea sp.]